jgi:hypothetical protein
MILQYMAVAVALAALGVSVSAARSDQYPTLNTAPVCHGITEQSDLEAGLRNESFAQCMQAEQAERNAMIKEWATFSSDDKTHCVAATMGGLPKASASISSPALPSILWSAACWHIICRIS